MFHIVWRFFVNTTLLSIIHNAYYKSSNQMRWCHLFWPSGVDITYRILRRLPAFWLLYG